MSAKVSFIVSVYNLEKYIEECAQSLFEQTMEDIEIVFVNDASTDSSEAIIRHTLENYSERKEQVKIVTHEKNTGIAETRKDGFYAATGEYFIFMDGDDYVETRMGELMYAKAVETGADMVVCDYKRHMITREKISTQVPQGVVGNGENVRDDMINRRVTGNIWCKLIRRTLFLENDIVWPANRGHEDMVLSTVAAYYARKIAHVPVALYHYVYRLDSFTNIAEADFVAKKMQLYVKNNRVIFGFLKREGVAERYAEGILTNKVLAKNMLLPYTDKLKYRRLWLQTYPEVNKILVFGSKEYRSTYREKIWLLAIWMGLYPKMKRRLLSKRFKPERIWSLRSK